MNEEKVYEPVVRQQEAEHYVSTSDLIQFIVINAPMEWNKCCDYVYKSRILSHEENDLYDYSVVEHPENYNEDQVKWIIPFFKAHPWIKRVRFVFDD